MSGLDINWTYGESDPALMLWTAAYQRWGLRWPCAEPNVLELGCQESDFAERMIRLNPMVTVTGVDVREERAATGWRFVKADAAGDARLFPKAYFDAVVILGALEHFGLGFYGDPLRDDGDTRCMQHVAEWLKPGGWVYFDVPCNPTFSIAENRHFRTYAPASVGERLIVPGLVERVRGYSDCEPHAGSWMPGPPTEHKVPYHFVAVVADKPAV